MRALFTLRRDGREKRDRQKLHVGQKLYCTSDNYFTARRSGKIYQKDSNKEEFYVLFREKAENGSVK